MYSKVRYLITMLGNHFGFDAKRLATRSALAKLKELRSLSQETIEVKEFGASAPQGQRPSAIVRRNVGPKVRQPK